MWCYLESGRAPDQAPLERRQPLDHSAGFRNVSAIRIHSPLLMENSVTRQMARSNVIALETGPEHILEIQFDAGPRGMRRDFRPDLPLIFRW